MYEYGVGVPNPLFLLQASFPCYEHTHNVGEELLSFDSILLVLRLPYGVNIKGGRRLSRSDSCVTDEATTVLRGELAVALGDIQRHAC